jgi:hypothetical protein
MSHPSFYVPGATAVFLDYDAAEAPKSPRLLLIFETPEESVVAAGPEDFECDLWDITSVIEEVEYRLTEHYVPTRRLVPTTFFAEWDLVPK